MIFLPLPTEDAGSFTQRTRLDGIDYAVRFSHNTRSDSYSLDLDALDSSAEGSAEGNVPIVTGAKIYIGNDLLRYAIRSGLCPLGALFALSSDRTRRAPRLGELGTRVRLCYLSFGETF